MADRTSGGAVVSDKSRQAVRRLELQVHQNRGAIMQAELDIETLEDQIVLRQRQIVDTEKKNAELAQQIEQLKTVEMTGKEQSHG